MGKRASKRKRIVWDPVKKKAAKTLPTTFPCLFCNGQETVMVRLVKEFGVGDLSCSMCDQRFQSPLNNLSETVDVYADWVDACEAVAKAAADSPADSSAADDDEMV